MTGTSRASEVWQLLVDPLLTPDPYRAVDMVMELDGCERTEAVRRLHEAAVEWLRSKRLWDWPEGPLSFQLRDGKLDDAANTVKNSREVWSDRPDMIPYYDCCDQMIELLRMLQSLPV